jgi:hypothetical protein
LLTKPELAIDSEGQPFMPPPDVVGWRVRRIEGRGRPELVHDTLGRPIILPVTATFPELYRAAGPGKYRLDPVDATGLVCPDVPVGCTGMMQTQTRASDEPSFEMAIATPSIASTQGRDIHDLLIHVVHANTRMAEQIIHGIPAMLSAASGLITAADGAKLTSRPPPAPLPTEPDDDDDSEDEDEDKATEEPESTTSGWLDAMIRHTVNAVIDQVKGKFAGLPLSALFDWSKAMPQQQASEAVPFAAHAAPRWSAAAQSTPMSSQPTWEESAASAPMPGDVAWFATPAGAGAYVPPPYAPAPMAHEAVPDHAIMFTQPPLEPSAPIPPTPAPLAQHPPMSGVDAGSPSEATMPPPQRYDTPVASMSSQVVAPTSVPLPDLITALGSASDPSNPNRAFAAPRASAPSAPPGPGPVASPSAQATTNMAPPATAPSTDASTSMTNLAPRNRKRAHTDDSTALSSVIATIWNALTPAERERAQAIAEVLTVPERVQWLRELAVLDLPDALARVRNVIRPHTSASKSDPTRSA